MWTVYHLYDCDDYKMIETIKELKEALKECRSIRKTSTHLYHGSLNDCICSKRRENELINRINDLEGSINPGAATMMLMADAMNNFSKRAETIDKTLNSFNSFKYNKYKKELIRSMRLYVILLVINVLK